MGCIVCLLVDWPISGRLWYVILVALKGIILIVIL